MAASNTMNDATQDAKEQIAQLREAGADADERTRDARAGERRRQAEEYVRQAKGIYDDQTEMLSERVRESPVIALLVAAGVGYLLGRIAR